MTAGGATLRVTHVITGLSPGGAETALFRTILATRDDARHAVVSLTDHGVYGPRLAAEGIPVTSLGMRPGIPDPLAVIRLARWFHRDRPDLLHCWMYHANLVAGLAAVAARGIPVVWGIRHADLDARTSKRSTRWTSAACARLSRWIPSRIVCCAEAARRSHEAQGYCSERMVVIPNGFDAGTMVADPRARARLRLELAIPVEAPVVGLVSRFHPDKDPDCFLRAARQVATARPDAVFLLAGAGLEACNPPLAARIRELRIGDRVRLLGSRPDVPALLAAMDVFVLCSRTEAFPNALAEAMLCGLACVATDCGDVGEILSTSGRLVPPGDSEALGRSCLELLALGAEARAALGAAARERVRARYDIRRVAHQYLDLYEEVTREHARPARRGEHPMT